MQYGFQVWGQKQGTTNIERLQKNPVRLIYFKSKNDAVNPLWLNGRMFFYKLSGCVLGSRSCERSL